MSKTGTGDDIASMPFEQALQELEAIVGQLEKGAVPLEDSIRIYERGEALKSHCERLLLQAEARIEKINLSASGEPTGATAFDPEA
ncbi:MAG: exodeoxyribonuclease VII small subunit [Salinarimonadaceae bacterium]|nr:MAG: exodeoxyribonuclease VII small subunit [Salinarimonadaceae bacterium]